MDFIKKSILTLTLGTSVFFNVNAQNSIQKDYSNMRDGEHVEYCVTHKLETKLRQNPQYIQQSQQDQLLFQQALEDIENSPMKRGVIYKIPVVFHVIHNNGTENISDEQILDALRILNRDYRKQNADTANVVASFRNLIGDSEIEFVLATKAPNGQCFSGITRTVSPRTVDSASDNYDGEDQVQAIVQGNDVYNGQWPPNKYLNIVIAKEINGAAGYTFKPASWSGSSMYYNSIFMLSNYVGSIGTSSDFRSRALSHEVGHWLNLSHTWGDTNNPGVSCGDDNVSDTPETEGVTSCNLGENTCGVLANVENYMDYSYCSKMFTKGQVTRMRAALTSSVAGRNNLWKGSNLSAVSGLCEPIFSSDVRIICAGQSVQFTNQTMNITSLNWNFVGGTPASSTTSSPSIVYNTPGKYSVSLTASDGSVTSTKNETAYIIVLPNSNGIPFFENFDSYTSDANVNTVYPISNDDVKFELFTSAGYSGNNSYKLANFNQTGGVDEFTSIPFDLSGLSSSDQATLSFRYAYRKKVSSNTETLRVLFSKNCGETWEPRKSLTGNSISNLVTTSNYVPTKADWKTVHTNVTNAFFVNGFRFTIRLSAAGGNNLYIDDINLYKGGETNSLGIEEEATIGEFVIYPNPVESVLNIDFDSKGSEKVSIEIHDLTGKIVDVMSFVSNSGENSVIMNTEKLVSGMYFANVITGSSRLVKSFIVK